MPAGSSPSPSTGQSGMECSPLCPLAHFIRKLFFLVRVMAGSKKAGVIEVLEGGRQGQIELPTVNENNVLFPSELHCSKFGFLKVSLLSRTGTERASMVASLLLGPCK